MIKLLLFLWKNRYHKKWQMNKRVLHLSFDLTLVFYIVVFTGYIITAIILDGNLIDTIKSNMAFMDRLTLEQVKYVILIAPIFYFIRGFSQPGVLFSSAEFKLSLLPFLKRRIWFVLALQRWMKSTCLFIIIGMVYVVFSDTPVSTIFCYILILMLMNMLMTVLEWRFFQFPIWLKITCLLVPILLNVVQVYMDIALIFVMLFLLGLLNIICYRSMMQQINWQTVTTAADFKIWNMPIISRVTKVKFKRMRKYTLWQRFSFWKKPFVYQKQTMYHRLWQLHLEKNTKYIFQIICALLLLLTVLGFLREWLFLLAIIITIHIFSQLIVGLFKDRFKVDIVAILPWDLDRFRKTFRIWAFSLGSVLLFPIGIYLIFHFDAYHLAVFSLLMLLSILQMEEILMKQVHLLDKSYPYNEKVIQGCFLGMVLIFLSNMFILLLYPAIIITIILFIIKLLDGHGSNTQLSR